MQELASLMRKGRTFLIPGATSVLDCANLTPTAGQRSPIGAVHHDKSAKDKFMTNMSMVIKGMVRITNDEYEHRQLLSSFKK